MKKNISIIDKHRSEVRKRLLHPLHDLVYLNNGIPEMKPHLHDKLASKPDSYTILAREVLIDIYSDLNPHILFGNEGEPRRVEVAYSKYLESGNKDFLFDLKDDLKNEYNLFIEKYNLNQHRGFRFVKGDFFFLGLNFLYVYMTLCDTYRLEKFIYFVDEYSKANGREGIDLNISFNIMEAFPDAHTLFSHFLDNRFDLFYLNYLIIEDNVISTNSVSNKGDIELFSPDLSKSEFATVLNKIEGFENLPELLYDYLRQTNYEKDNPFFARLSHFLQNAKYNGKVLMRKSSKRKYKGIVSEYLGTEYKFDFSKHINNYYSEMAEDLKKYFRRNNIIIKHLYT